MWMFALAAGAFLFFSVLKDDWGFDPGDLSAQDPDFF